MSFPPPSLHVWSQPSCFNRLLPETHPHTRVHVILYVYVFLSEHDSVIRVTVFSAHLHAVCDPHLPSLFYPPLQTIMSQRRVCPRSYSLSVLAGWNSWRVHSFSSSKQAEKLNCELPSGGDRLKTNIEPRRVSLIIYMAGIWLIPWLSKWPVALLLAFCVFKSMFELQMNVCVFTITSLLLLIQLLASLPHSHNAPLPSLLAHMLCLLLQVTTLSNGFLWSTSLTNILHDVYKEIIIYFAGVHLCSFTLCVLLMCNLVVSPHSHPFCGNSCFPGCTHALLGFW